VSGDELGAHVSSAGGVQNAPARAQQLGSAVLQLFTKQPSRWAEPVISSEAASAFRAARAAAGIWFASAHDSYLINLATSDAVLFARSCASFRDELARCALLGLDALVTHPGNATGGDRERALERNAQAVSSALSAQPSDTMVLFETTAGSGTALGASFGELGELIRLVGPDVRHRVGVCVDTCHLWAAGYDLASEYDAVIAELHDAVGLERVRLFHLNDSVGGLGSRRDRHAHIGKGKLGAKAFRRLLNDARFSAIPKVIETPKDDDVLAADRRNLARLRAYRSAGVSARAKRANKSKTG